jgi:hypothetical protein
MMNVTASFHGILADWVGTRSAKFNLPSAATYADLMTAIRRGYAQNMPPQLWDDRKNMFKNQVIVAGKGPIADIVNLPLNDDEVVEFLLMIAGG